MGGKVWTDAEERYFWRVTISQSPKRVGFDLANMEKSWDQLARDLQDAMGIDARRNYSGTMLFEHFLKNIEYERPSPNAAPYVREYLYKRDNPRVAHPYYTRPVLPDPSAPWGSPPPPPPSRSDFIGLVCGPNVPIYPPRMPPRTGADADCYIVSSRAIPSPIPRTGFAIPSLISDSVSTSPFALDVTIPRMRGSPFSNLTMSEESELEEGEIRETPPATTRPQIRLPSIHMIMKREDEDSELEEGEIRE